MSVISAEDRATHYLRGMGWRILRRNSRIHGVEIDIMAKNTTGEIILVEVKKIRKPESNLFPPVSGRQLKRYRRAADALAAELPLSAGLDVHLVLVSSRGEILAHHPGILWTKVFFR